MDEESIQRLRSLAEVQKRIRRILVLAMATWRSDLALEDLQIDPIIMHIRGYVKRFQDVHGNIRQACAATQWQQLSSAISCPDAEGGAEEPADVKNDTRKRKAEELNCGLFHMMRTAMARLGGQATMTELHAAIREMPDVDRLSERISRNKHSNGMLVWEQSVGRNMGSLFDPVLDENGAQVKRGRSANGTWLKVWQAKADF